MLDACFDHSPQAEALSQAALLTLLTSQSMDKCHAVDPRELRQTLCDLFEGRLPRGGISHILLDLVTSQSADKTAAVDIREVRALIQASI